MMSGAIEALYIFNQYKYRTIVLVLLPHLYTNVHTVSPSSNMSTAQDQLPLE